MGDEKEKAKQYIDTEYYTIPANPDFLNLELQLTEESKKLFELGKPGQGYIGIVEVVSGKIHLLPSFNKSDGLIREDKNGGDFRLEGQTQPQYLQSRESLGKLTGDLHDQATSHLGLLEISSTRKGCFGFGLWKAGPGIKFMSYLPEEVARVPDEYILVNEKGDWKLYYTDKENEAKVIAIGEVQGLGSLLEKYDGHHSLESQNESVHKIESLLIDFHNMQQDTVDEVNPIKLIKNRSTSQNTYACEHNNQSFNNFFSECSLDEQVHKNMLERELPEPVFERIISYTLKDISNGLHEDNYNHMYDENVWYHFQIAKLWNGFVNLVNQEFIPSILDMPLDDINKNRLIELFSNVNMLPNTAQSTDIDDYQRSLDDYRNSFNDFLEEVSPYLISDGSRYFYDAEKVIDIIVEYFNENPNSLYDMHEREGLIDEIRNSTRKNALNQDYIKSKIREAKNSLEVAGILNQLPEQYRKEICSELKKDIIRIIESDFSGFINQVCNKYNDVNNVFPDIVTDYLAGLDSNHVNQLISNYDDIRLLLATMEGVQRSALINKLDWKKLSKFIKSERDLDSIAYFSVTENDINHIYNKIDRFVIECNKFNDTVASVDDLINKLSTYPRPDRVRLLGMLSQEKIEQIITTYRDLDKLIKSQPIENQQAVLAKIPQAKMLEFRENRENDLKKLIESARMENKMDDRFVLNLIFNLHHDSSEKYRNDLADLLSQYSYPEMNHYSFDTDDDSLKYIFDLFAKLEFNKLSSINEMLEVYEKLSNKLFKYRMESLDELFTSKMEALLKANFTDIDIRNEFHNLMIYTIYQKNTNQMRLFLSTLDRVGGLDKMIDRPDRDGWTLIHHAVQFGNLDNINLIVNSGADVNSADIAGGYTPLHLAASLGNAEVVSLLISRGAEYDKMNQEGKSALHLAVESQSSEVVKTLINAGADVSVAYEGSAYTPLILAILLGHEGMANILFESNKLTGNDADIKFLHDEGVDFDNLKSFLDGTFNTTFIDAAIENINNAVKNYGGTTGELFSKSELTSVKSLLEQLDKNSTAIQKVCVLGKIHEDLNKRESKAPFKYIKDQAYSALHDERSYGPAPHPKISH